MVWALHVRRWVRDLKKGTGEEALSLPEYILRGKKIQCKHSQRSLGINGIFPFIYVKVGRFEILGESFKPVGSLMIPEP